MGNDGKLSRIDARNAISVQKAIANADSNKRPTEMEFLTPYDLHRRWGRAISIKTLANWRSLSYGPPYTRMGGRVLYRVSDVLTWENQNRFNTRI